MELPDGTIIYESRVIMELAHEIGGDNGLELYPKDPVATAQYKLKMEEYNQILPVFYGFMFGPNEETTAKLRDGIVKLESFFTSSLGAGKTWVMNTAEPSIVDIHSLPYIERILSLRGSAYEDHF